MCPSGLQRKLSKNSDAKDQPLRQGQKLPRKVPGESTWASGKQQLPLNESHPFLRSLPACCSFDAAFSMACDKKGEAFHEGFLRYFALNLPNFWMAGVFHTPGIEDSLTLSQALGLPLPSWSSTLLCHYAGVWICYPKTDGCSWMFESLAFGSRNRFFQSVPRRCLFSPLCLFLSLSLSSVFEILSDVSGLQLKSHGHDIWCCMLLLFFFKVFAKEWRWEPYLNVITKLLCSVLLCCLTIHLFPTVQEACKSGSVTLLQVQTCWCPTHRVHHTSMLVRTNRSFGDLSSLDHKTRPHMLWFSPTRVLDMKHSWNDFASANFVNAMLARADQTSNIWKAVQNARKCKPASISSDLSSTSQSPSRRTGYTMNCGCFISEYTVADSSCIGLKAPSLLHTSHI